MKEYKEAEKKLEKIKESEDVGELERFFSKDHMTFQSLVKNGFSRLQPPSRVIRPPESTILKRFYGMWIWQSRCIKKQLPTMH